MSHSSLGFTSVSVAAAPWLPDLGDGTYRNPVLYADYSDPDAIRVGEDFYLIASSFTAVPGLPVLHSRDLVNWRLLAHALPQLVPVDHYATPRHGGGVWAPSIRHHDGRFWIYYPDPDFGLHLITAEDPAGPWSEPIVVVAGKGLIDPCPLWADDGQLYLIHGWAKSRSGICNVLTLLRLSADGRQVEEDFGVIIDGNAIDLPDFHTLEGPKLYQRHGWTYIFAPAGGVSVGWQSVFRARDIRGPYEHRVVLHQGSTAVNGPHQGALVDTPDGASWFLHFQDQDAYGRVVHLQPVQWIDDWPMMGALSAANAPGEPVTVHAKPQTSAADDALPDAPATSDDFRGPHLGLQWQWQGNPRADWHTLDAAPGALRLFAQPEPHPGNLYLAPHLLLQKFPAPRFTVTTQLDFDHGVAAAAPGATAGLIVFGYDYAWIGLRATATGLELRCGQCPEASALQPQSETVIITACPARLWLRLTVAADAQCQFASSDDGKIFTAAGPVFAARCGKWVGAKFGLFAATTNSSAASAVWADFRDFQVRP